MKLLPLLSSLIQKNFSGKLNILYEQNNQFLAYIAISEKRIVRCKYGGWEGKSALLELLLFMGDCSDQLFFIEEPEIIGVRERDINIDLKELELLLTSYFESEKFAPSNKLKLLVAGDFIVAGEAVGLEEFQLLGTISDYSCVEEIYRHSMLSPAQTLVHLVSLRRKKALKVLGRA